ncbi:hypothetical protein H0H81_008793 [Sphagnurus paluster]|uniref:CBM1 domain-containing protein n=1 Tax=Sphagnurus paluster TaxID=117069 RepID=A0A9P7FVY2_9AGAR|nr:hypothetical protein H0H81_008793 [Sphagnurus paluster]
MKLVASFVALALFVTSSLAAQPVWAQCGGIGWTGDKRSSSTTAPPSSSSSITPTSVTSTTSSSPPTSTGFVKTSGTRFTLDGQTYTVVGFVMLTQV